MEHLEFILHTFPLVVSIALDEMYYSHTVTLSPLSALGALQVTVRDHGYPHVPHYLEVPKMLGYLGGKTPELVSLTVIQGKENRHTDLSGAVCPPKLRKIYFRGLPAWTASLFLAGSPNLAELYLDNIYDFPWPNPMAVRKDSPWDDFEPPVIPFPTFPDLTTVSIAGTPQYSLDPILAAVKTIKQLELGSLLEKDVANAWQPGDNGWIFSRRRLGGYSAVDEDQLNSLKISVTTFYNKKIKKKLWKKVKNLVFLVYCQADLELFERLPRPSSTRRRFPTCLEYLSR